MFNQTHQNINERIQLLKLQIEQKASRNLRTQTASNPRQMPNNKQIKTVHFTNKS